MSRTLLLCFIHGFKGNDDTFREFPNDLKRVVSKQLPDHRIESVVYPKYETKGELAQATESFLGWLRERVMDIRKEHVEKPWPPNDRRVGVVLVAHSMGGFVAADTLFLSLSDRESGETAGPIFPLIQGILTFDTPYNGLARSMFVYGAFSNYQKVSSVFNVMTALAAAAPSTLSRLATRRAAGSALGSVSSSNPAWKTWQLVAVRSGTVGAIAAGGVAAYTHREAIMKGMKSVRNLNKESVVEGYRQSVASLGQGLAYINRGNVGQSFAWLSDHFTFVGALLKQKELARRLERMGALKGVGIHDFYCSLGENGYWSGGYFVPERTFCAIPAADHAAYPLFTRCVIGEIEDEIQAHMGMFQPEKNKGYEKMTDDASTLVKEWFLSDSDVVDDEKFRETPPEEAAEDKKIQETLEKGEDATEKDDAPADEAASSTDAELPDESPIDIAAAASLVPLPDDTDMEGELVTDASPEAAVSDERKTYMNHLFQVAQQAGTGIKGMWPAKMPNLQASVSSIGQVSIPRVSMPQVSMPNVSLPNVSMPSVNIFSKKQPAEEVEAKIVEADVKTDAEDPKPDAAVGDPSNKEVSGA